MKKMQKVLVKLYIDYDTLCISISHTIVKVTSTQREKLISDCLLLDKKRFASSHLGLKNWPASKASRFQVLKWDSHITEQIVCHRSAVTQQRSMSTGSWWVQWSIDEHVVHDHAILHTLACFINAEHVCLGIILRVFPVFPLLVESEWFILPAIT